MNEKHNRRFQKLLKAFDRLGFWSSIIIVLVLSSFYVLIAFVGQNPPSSEFSRIAKSFFMDLIAGTIPVYLLFIGSYALLRHIKEIRQEEEQNQLVAKIKLAVQSVVVPNPLLFLERTDATPDMEAEMMKHRKMVFIGLSQSSLDHYLKGVLQRGSELPWEEIKIYFSMDEVGISWEGKVYKENLKNSRQAVATLLTDQAYREQLPDLKSISFQQCNQPLMYGGSMFGGFSLGTKKCPIYNVIYVVQYLPSKTPDSKKALTWKIRYENQEHQKSEGRQLLTKYTESYEIIEDKAENLGEFKPSAWDMSATEWIAFCEAYYPGKRNSIYSLVDLAKLNGDEKVMDVAAGTGFTSKILLDALPNGELTVLEGSPRMLSSAIFNLKTDNRLHYALCPLPIPKGGDVDVDGCKYDVIFCHLAIFAIAHDKPEMEAFAQWCVRHLKSNGRVVFNAHNGVLQEMPHPKGYETWEDLFLSKLKEILEKRNFEFRKDTQLSLTKEIIEEAFTDAGLKKVNSDFKKARDDEDIFDEWPISMEQRMRLWTVPAVLDTLVSINDNTIRKGRRIVEEAYESVIRSGFKTMPRSVISWIFMK